MAPPIKSATERALRLHDKGMSAYQAAKKCGIAYSTIWRAIRRREQGK